MKTYCKNVDPSDVKTIEPFVWEALSSKLKRKDYSEFAARYCELDGKEIRRHARMGYVVTAKGKIKIRRRVFIRARRAFFHSADGDDRLKVQRRVSAYYGFFKAAGIRTLRRPNENGQGKSAAISIRAIQTKASILISQKARRDLLCAA